jgi:uncharacterized protein with GYD domain
VKAQATKTAEDEMLRYRLDVNYIRRVRKVLIKEPNRSGALFSVVEQLGGKIEHVQRGHGEFDAVLILDMPDCESFGALVTTLVAGGAVKSLRVTPKQKIKEWYVESQAAGPVSCALHPH